MSSPYLSEQLRTPRQQAADTLVSRLEKAGGVKTGCRFDGETFNLWLRFATEHKSLVSNAVRMAIADDLPFALADKGVTHIRDIAGDRPLYEVKLRVTE